MIINVLFRLSTKKDSLKERRLHALIRTSEKHQKTIIIK